MTPQIEGLLQNIGQRACAEAEGADGLVLVGGQATPMRCVSPKSGQQSVVMSAGGARLSPDRGDCVIACRLKR